MMTASKLVIEIAKRWRNDPGNGEWTTLLREAALCLPGTGTIQSQDAAGNLYWIKNSKRLKKLQREGK